VVFCLDHGGEIDPEHPRLARTSIGNVPYRFPSLQLEVNHHLSLVPSSSGCPALSYEFNSPIALGLVRARSDDDQRNLGTW